MTPRKLRTHVAAFTTSVGLLVLLGGPTATFGLSVPGADSTTSQLTSAVQTTEQTVATTVTQVQSTVRTTVGSTTQTVAAPAPSAPAPVQTTVQKAASAPKPAVTRVATPAKKRTAAPSKAPRLSATRTLSRATGSAGTTVTKHSAVARTHRTSTSRPTAATPRSPATASAPVQCDVALLAALPAMTQLGGLLTLACDAVNALDLPSRVGLDPHSSGDSPSLGDLLGTPSSAPAARSRARIASAGGQPRAVSGRPAAVSAANSGALAGRSALPLAAGAGHAAAIAYVDSFRTPAASGGLPVAAQASAAETTHHHTWFSGESRGTEVLMAILFASLSILGGIVLWRLAVRWVIPRFA